MRCHTVELSRYCGDTAVSSISKYIRVLCPHWRELRDYFPSGRPWDKCERQGQGQMWVGLCRCDCARERLKAGAAYTICSCFWQERGGNPKSAWQQNRRVALAGIGTSIVSLVAPKGLPGAGERASERTSALLPQSCCLLSFLFPMVSMEIPPL